MGMSLNKIFAIVIAMLMLFILASTMFMGFFATGYEHGFGTEPCNKDGCDAGETALSNPRCLTHSTTVLTCASCNATAGYEFFLANCGDLISVSNNTDCYQCTAFQGYFTSMQGLLLLVLVMALIGFAVAFIPKVRL